MKYVEGTMKPGLTKGILYAAPLALLLWAMLVILVWRVLG